MRFSFYERDSLGIAGITATPEHYDSVPPVSTVLFDFDLRKMNRDRFAVAAVLFFSEYLSGPIHFPDDVSPEIAIAIEEYLSVRNVRVMTVNYEPYAAASGLNRIDVSSVLRGSDPVNSPGAVRTIYLDSLRSDKWFGSISNIDHIVTSTNAHVIASESSVRNFELLCATGLSFCDLFVADSLRVRSNSTSADLVFSSVGKLLAACNVELCVD